MSIQVTAFLNPFSKKKNEFHFAEAISIQEIIKKIDSLHAVNTGWRVLIDDEIITDFTRIPKDGQHVFLKIVPESDNESTGIGMKVGGALAVVGGIAAIAFLGWTGIGGVAGVALIGAGVGCFAGGAVLYNIDIPSVSTNKKKQEAPDQDPSIRGSENQMRPYGVIPTLFGRRRIYADLAATSFTWAENGSVYLYQLFCAGQKDMTIDTDTIKIDETLLKDYSASKNINTILAGNDQLIDMRIHQDGSMPLLYDKCVHEEQVNAILKHETEEGLDGSVIRTLPAGAKEINIDIFFYNGLGKYGNDGNLGETSVEVTSWYKESDEDDSAYQTLGYFTLTQAKYHRQNFRVLLRRYVGVSKNTIWDSFSSWSRIDGDNFTINPDNKSLYTVVIRTTTPISYDPRFKIVEFSVAYTDAIVGTNTITASELKTKRYSITKTGLDESKSYTVKISRTSADSTDTKVIDDVYVGSIRAAKNMLPVQAERASQLTLIELKIKASEKLNNVVKELNFVAESKLPSYSGSGSGVEQWTYANSRNPASAIMYAMQGDFAQQKLTNDDIEWPMFENLYTWCQNHGYECNAYLTEQMPISVLLSSIASTCRAEVLRTNGKLTVIQDIERDSFTQLFTPRNSHDYSESIALSEIPDAQNLNFVDESSGYAENSARIYNTPDGNYAGEPGTTQEVSLWGVTDKDQALKLGMYNYAVSNHRFLLHKFSCDFEYLMCQKGDWIKYAGDLALAGITQGRITDLGTDENGKTTAFECDEVLPMENGKNYGMRVRKANGESVIIYLENIEHSSKVAILSSAIEAATSPQAGDLFTFGEVSGAKLDDAIDLVITDIQCGENLSAELTCVEYSPEIFGVDDPDFELPEFENHLSEVQGKTDLGQVWQTFYTYHDGDETPDTPTGDGTDSGWHHVRTTESNWVSVKTAASIYEGSWSAPTYSKGPKGGDGKDGTNATQYYIHFVYCDDTSKGTNYSTSESRKYVGVYTDTNLEDAATFNDAKNKTGIVWSKAEGEDGAKGATGNYTKRILLYCVTTSTTAPATPTQRVTSTTAATGTTWTQGKYTTYAVGKYYYTCEQVETYNASGTYQSCTWASASRDMEYENAGAAKLRAAGRYIGKLTAASTANGYTASSNWDWFLATSAISINNFGKAGTAGATVAGNIYVWNGSYWTKDSDSSHLVAAMNDMIALIDTYTTNSTSVGAFATVFARTMAAKSGFFDVLFGQEIVIQEGGSFRGGERYDANGALKAKNKTGFWLDTTGTIRANLQSDNGNILLGDNAGLKLNHSNESNGMYNVAAGYEALKSATSAHHNVAIGTQSLLANTSGSRNVALGEQCLKANTTGNNNTVAGYGFISNTTGSNNVGIGGTVGSNNTTGSNNISIGNTITHLSNADKNIFIGNSITHNINTSNAKDKNDNVVVGNGISIGDANTRYADGNILIGKGIRFSCDSTYEASQNIFIGSWKNGDADTTTNKNFVFPSEGDVPAGVTKKNYFAINIGDVYLSQAMFFLSAQDSITGKEGIRAALVKQALFEKGSSSWGRVYGVQEYNFGTSSGYIKYTNGLCIQWGNAKLDGVLTYFPLSSGFTQPPIVIATRIGNEYVDTSIAVNEISETSFKSYTSGKPNDPRSYIAIGY